MKKNSWKTFLSVVLLLTMLVSMLPSAAFAEEAQSADAQTAAEETVKAEENKDTAKGEAKAENKDTAKEEAKAENKDAVKEEAKAENKDAAKEEAKTENKDAVKEEAKTENKDAAKEVKTEPEEEPKEESEDEPEEDTKDEAVSISVPLSGGTAITSDTTLKYDANCTDSIGPVPASETKAVEKGKTGSFTVKGNGTLTRPGYTFAGWTENAAGTGTVYNENDTITVAAGTTKTLYAKWEKIPEQVEITLTYDPNGGNGDQHKDTEKVTEGESYTFTIKSPDAIGITAKDGYEFAGWNTKADGTGDAVTGTITISASTTIYAQWKKLPTTVIYHANGGTATTDPVIRADVDPSAYRVETIGEVGFTAPSGKTFLTWNTEQDGGGTFYDPGAAIDIRPGATLELWARWFESTTPTPDLPDWNGLEITKVTDPETATVAPGEELTYKITVTNHTGVDLTDVVVVDTLPAGVTFVRASDGSYNNADRTVTLTIPALAKDAVHSFTVTVTVDAETVGTITNTAKTISAVGGMTELSEEISASVTTPVEPKPGPAPDWDATLRITKETPNMADGKVTLGDEFTYTITVWNSSDYTMENIVVSDTLPSEVDYVSCSGGLTYDSDTRTLTATIDSLDPGYKTFGITVRVADVSSDTITNTAKLTHAECNGNVWDGVKEATVSIDVVQPIEISKTVDKTTAAPGDTLTYTITVTNNISDAIILNVIDTLPQNITVDEATISNDGYYDRATRTISWSVALSTKEVRELSFKAVIDADFAGDVIAANHVQTTFNDVVYAADSDPVEVMPLVEMDATVTVKFVGLDKDTKLPAGYTLTGDKANEFLSGAITLTKDETADTMTYTGKISAVPGKAYDLKFAQTGFNVDGYKCDATAAVSKTVTADAKKGVEVTITLNYTKTDAEKTEMPVAVNVKFVGLDKDTKLPAYTLTGAPANEFLSGAVALTKDETADTMTYTGKIQAVPGKAYGLSFIQSGFDVAGFICDASVVVTKNVTADAKTGVVVDLVLTYTKINWGGLTITKTADKTYATPGSYVKYTITVTNKTGVDLTNVNVLDYLPSTVRYSSSFGGYNSGTSSWTIARLADGKSATATIRVKLNSGLSTGTKIENTAYVTSVTIDGQEYVFENLWLNDTAIVIVTDGKGAPKTGDESNLGLWIAVMAASLACAGAAAVIYKKRRTGND